MNHEASTPHHQIPLDLVGRLDDAAFAARLTRDELLIDICRKGLSGGEQLRPSWISQKEAAKRSSLHVGHIRKLCAEQYESRGLARKVRRGNSRSGWEIREDANPAFSPVPAARNGGD